MVWSAAVPEPVTGEIRRAMLPLVLSSYSTAEPWKRRGQPVCVDHRGVSVTGPDAGVRLSLPGCVPVTVGADGTARADGAVSTAAPTTTQASPASAAIRRSPGPGRHLSRRPHR